MEVDSQFYRAAEKFGLKGSHEKIIRLWVMKRLNEILVEPAIFSSIFDFIGIILNTSSSYSSCFGRVSIYLDQKVKTKQDFDKLVFYLIVLGLIAKQVFYIEEFVILIKDMYKKIAAASFKVPYKEVTAGMVNVVKAINVEYGTSELKQGSGWDGHYYDVVKGVAGNSKCLSRKVGALLVRDKSIIGSGYNGPPRGVPPCSGRWFIDQELKKRITSKNKEVIKKKMKTTCPRRILNYKSGEALHLCVAGHAERNALINSAREGIKVKNSKLYLTCGLPCTPCMVEIINAGVEEVIVTSSHLYDLETRFLIENSSIEVRIYDFIIKEFLKSKKNEKKLDFF